MVLSSFKLFGEMAPGTWLGEGDPEVRNLVFDSREAKNGSLFFALRGTHADGHSFIDEAYRQGCRAFVVEKVPKELYPQALFRVVANSRWAMSPLSSAFYSHPSRKLEVIGVTGTDGKSSTVSFLFQLLSLAGKKTGFFSTVEFQIGQETRKNALRQSTPEAPQIHQMLLEMVESGCTHAVLESTSHGLSEITNRLGDVIYQGAVFTNVTTEHLEFHGTLEAYRQAKTRLFTFLDKGPLNSWGVVNFDDPHAHLFREATNRSVIGYAIEDLEAELRATDIQSGTQGLEFTLHWKGKSQKTSCPVAGRFNVYNLMAALLAASQSLKVDPLDLAPLLEKLKGVKGRMFQVNQGQPFDVYVDYAHTPGAFSSILPGMNQDSAGRLIVVFGSGGERDRAKRPQQGQIADRYSDVIILTDEDPRLENPDQILSDIASGIVKKTRGETLFLIRPRQEALRKAFEIALPGDRVLLLGKGHESSIVLAQGPTPWDEAEEAKNLLKDLGWRP